MYTTESNSTQMPIGWPIDIPKQGYLGLLQPWFQQISELYPPHPSWRCLYLIRKKNSSLIWRNCASCSLWFENYLAFIWGEFNQSYALIPWNKQLVVVHRKVDNRIPVIHMVNDALHIYHTNPKAPSPRNVNSQSTSAITWMCISIASLVKFTWCLSHFSMFESTCQENLFF